MRSPGYLHVGIAIAALLLSATGSGWAAAQQTESNASQRQKTDRVAAEPANALRWTTYSEEDCFGFDVYRALARTGPFRLVTKKPIAGAGSSDVPVRYSFTDNSIEPGKAYWYYVERISMNGNRTRFTPLIFASAKRPGERDASAAPAAASEPRSRRP